MIEQIRFIIVFIKHLFYKFFGSKESKSENSKS